MCGFAAVVSVDRRATPELLLAMRDAMVHRGPDEAGLWVSSDNQIGFGHRRLSIIDLGHGHQPMASRSGRIILNYNGEVYNHLRLREKLERKGRRFATRCDTEVVLAAYEAFGQDCLHHLDGMFAFTIWDAERNSLFFARDRVGKKPLYYTKTRDGWAFASEIKALLKHPDVSRSVDREALAHYLSFLCTPAPDSLFEGIKKLPAGHCGTWSEADGLAIREWWAPPTDRAEGMELEDAASEVRRLFTTAVEKRMMSDVPFGAYLSGGVDSSANVALMSTMTSEPLHTFSISFRDEPGLDELSHARQVAERFGTRHHEIVIDDADVLACLPSLIHHQDEPIADPVCVPLYQLARFTKEEGVTVVQVGEGSDEIFFGYSTYESVMRTARALRHIHRFAPRRILGVAAQIAPSPRTLRGDFLAESLAHGIHSARRVPGFSEYEKGRLLKSGISYTAAYDLLRRVGGCTWADEEIATATLRHELLLRLPELLLMRVDKMTMASSVEARAPFLDSDLIEFAARLPLGLRWQQGKGKLILREAMKDLLPGAVLERRKQGFGAPVWRWAEGLSGIAKSELLRDPMFEYFNPTVLRDYLDRPAERQHQGWWFWILLNFALWHRHWIEGEDLRSGGLSRRALAS